MALIQCSECGQQISDKAEFCPHCGLPMKQKAARRFQIRIGSTTNNGFAIWMKVLSILTLIGGIIYAFFGGIGVLITYIESAFILWSLGKIVQMIHETHEMVSGIHLDEISSNARKTERIAGGLPDEPSQNRSSQQSKHSVPNQSSPSPVRSSTDGNAKYAICPMCGHKSSIRYVRSVGGCVNCNYAFSDCWETTDS